MIDMIKRTVYPMIKTVYQKRATDIYVRSYKEYISRNPELFGGGM